VKLIIAHFLAFRVAEGSVTEGTVTGTAGAAGGNKPEEPASRGK